jgi:adenylyltransferase/sulfurtransferase
MTLSIAEVARYQRHLSLREVGVAGQEKLKHARVLVVGAGGLGSPAALYLAASGVGTLGLVDCDRVDLSNLQRQILYATTDVGSAKAATARTRLTAINPEIRVVAYDVELRATNIRQIFSGYDVVLDGTDRLSTRYLVNDACVALGKPLVSAAIHRFEGQAMTYVPRVSPCYRCLFPEAPESVVPSCAEAGVLGVLPGVLGAIQATEAIKLLVGMGECLTGRLLTYDALELRFREFRFERRADCRACSAPEKIELRDAPAVCADVAGLRRLAPAQLDELLSESDALTRLALVDVRSPKEYGAAHLLGSINIPIDELEGRMREIPADHAPVFICRSGTRSLRACALANAAGIEQPSHLEGGLLAWAATVDTAFPVASVD